jgi:hypothetical protein
MEPMLKALPAVLILALVAIVPSPPTALAANTDSSSAPARTPPPQIYHIITRPLCSELHKHIAPAVAMMLQNDHEIGKSPDLFKHYNQGALYGNNNDVSNAAGAPAGVSVGTRDTDSIFTPAQQMALLGMENLVSPIANNIIAIKKLLASPALTKGTGSPEDDAQLQVIKAKLLKALAAQEASLDIVNGFVDTQQLADIQHSGQEYIAAANQKEFAAGHGVQGTPTPLPGSYDPNAAGLAPNPYGIDLATVPGLTLGYNPVTRLLDGLNWTISETQTRENDAAQSVMSSAQLCGPTTPNTPAPH